MIHFVGAGSGAEDLITVRGRRLLRRADVVVYAGSLVNRALLKETRPGCALHDSAGLTLGEIVSLLAQADSREQEAVRLHTGDPCLYGAIAEQMRALDALDIAYDYTPGVSSFCGAAAALKAEYTLPGVSQTVILTRMAGRTPVPAGEGIEELAAHGATMVVFLSAGRLGELSKRLMEGGYAPGTPAALVYKATWPEERVVRCTVGTLAEAGRRSGIHKTALVTVGRFLTGEGEPSRLYDAGFSHACREGEEQCAWR